MSALLAALGPSSITVYTYEGFVRPAKPPAPTVKWVFRSLIVAIAPVDDSASTTRFTMPHWSRRVANASRTLNGCALSGRVSMTAGFAIGSTDPYVLARTAAWSERNRRTVTRPARTLMTVT